ncbi:MAG: hypothetical protein ACOC7J_05940 [Armatimonadota bacterium]
MEFVEYYRIIRRRIWIAIVLAALTSAVVVVVRLIPEEIDYPATGRMLVHETAQRQVRLVDNQAMMGMPEDAQQFWRDLNQFVASRYVMQAAADEMGISPAEATEQLEPARAERIENSSAIMIYVAASGVPASAFDPNESNARDVAVRYCDAVMARLDDVWRQRRAAELDQIRITLEQREPALQSEIAQIQRRADALAEEYAGAPPDGVLGSLTAELALVEQQIATGEVEKGAAEARAEALTGQAGQTPATGETTTPMTAADPRVQALQQAILEKQVELDEQLTRRTEEHEDVQALITTIERMEQRLAELEATVDDRGQTGPQTSLLLAQTTINANVERAAATRQLELLQQRANEIGNRLPDVRADARLYEEIAARLDAAQASYDNLLDSLSRIDSEEQLLAEATLFEILTEAEARHVPRGLASFIVKLIGAAAAGLGLGILLIFVLHYVDFSFQDEQEAERMLGVPVLAGIPRSDILIDEEIDVAEDTQEQEAEPDEGIF